MSIDPQRLDPFGIFGVEPRFRLDLQDLERRYRELQRALHPDRHVHAPAAERRMKLAKAIEVNEAYRKLRDDLQRAEALLARHAGELPASDMDPVFLMEIMELREALTDARRARDLGRIEALHGQVSVAKSELTEQLADGLDALAAPSQPPVSAEILAHLRQQLARLKYYARFLDEVAVIEDEAQDSQPSQ